MNSFVNVQVRILAAQAQRQLDALDKRIGGLENAFNRATKGAGSFSSILGGMRLDAFGSRVQWIGRQIEYNFTLPIIAAAAASYKLALANEAAFTRVVKVYGDAAHGAEFYSQEIEALRRNFEALSNAYGVNQEQTIRIAAAWAAAGSSGIALARSVELTMQTMILGELEAAEATKALISIQAQYGFQTSELIKVIHTLNMVENETATSLADLIIGFEKAAGMARTVGVDYRHLAAMIAAIVPAAGSASQAGNALKTIFAKLISPTRETSQVLEMIGINMGDLSWKSASMTDRLTMLSKKFSELSDAQQGVVSSVIAGAWQVNRFNVVMREIANTSGYYAKALNSTADASAVFAQAQKELNTVLSSSPRRLQIIWTMLQNAAADIIQPMIPLLLYLATAVQKLVQWFSNLNPAVQKLVIVLLLFVAAIGPIVRIGGALILLLAQLQNIFGLLIAPIISVTKGLYSLVRVPVIAFFTALSVAARGALRMLTIFGPAVAFAFQMAQNIVLAGVAALGIAYRVALGIMVATTTAFASGFAAAWRVVMLVGSIAVAEGAALITKIWSRLIVIIQGIILGGATLLGMAWRGMLWLILGLTFKFRVLMVNIWMGIIAFFRGIIPLMRAIGMAIATAMTGPWGIAIGLVIAIVMLFWDQIVTIFNAIVDGVVKAWNRLPAGIKNALLAVVRIVNAAVRRVYEAMQWINPWARHSPSLVENVTSGVAEIINQYSALEDIVDIFARAGLTLESFAEAVRRVERAAQLEEIAKQREDLKSYAADAIPFFDQLVSVLFPLKDLLEEIGQEVAAQQAVVDGWKTQLDAANLALQEQQDILQSLEDVASGYKTQLQDAQEELDRFANAPIQGMRAMEDAIFANEMESKRLRLEMMRMEDAAGPLDQLQGRIEAINGELEMLTGEQKALRNAGAGSDILQFYDDQIIALEQGKDAIIQQVQPIQDLADQIEQLGREAEMLDLEKSLAFDPLTRQIDQLINSMEEMPFEEILAGVTMNKAEVDRLTEAYKMANIEVENQKAVVDQLTKQRDLIQASYDAELAKLRELQGEYDLVESKIRDIEQALRDMSSAASGGRGLSPGAENFLNAAGGDFPDVGGMGGIGREGGFEDQSKLIDEFTKEIADKTKNMFGLFDFLEPIKKAWNAAMDWLKQNVGPIFGGVFDSIKGAIGGMGNPFERFQTWIQFFKDVWDSVVNAAKVVWELIGPEIVKAGKEIWAALQDAFKSIQPEIEKFKELIGPIGQVLQNTWTVLKPVLGVVLGLLLMIIKVVVSIFANVIGPVIRLIGSLIASIIKIFRGLIEFLVGVFTGDWKLAWQGIKDFFGGIWDAIWAILKGAVELIWGVIKGLVDGIVGFFTWLWDQLVGHSIIPDIVNGIMYWFNLMVDGVKFLMNLLVTGIKWVWENILKPIFNAFGMAVDGWKLIFQIVVDYIKGRWDDLVSKFQWAWGRVNEYINLLKNIFNTLKDNFVNNVNTVRGWIDTLVNAFNNIKNRMSLGSIFDTLKEGFRSAVNWIIGKWNNLEFRIGGGSFLGQNFPGMTIGTPNISYLARGGLIANEAMAVVGEGRKGYPEYVIPTDPIYRNRALALFANLAELLGIGSMLDGKTMFNALNKVDGFQHGAKTQFFASGGILGRGSIRSTVRGGGGVIFAPESKNTSYNFFGNLEFPNVRDGKDVEEFLRNLEALISE